MSKKSKPHKNVSKKESNGTIVQTRDNYFKGQKKYIKEGYTNKGNYRKAVVVDSNRKDELALVKITSSGEEIDGVKTRPFILTKDDLNRPIKESKKFIINKNKNGSPKNTIDSKTANSIKKRAVNNIKTGKSNRDRLKELKNK